MKIRIRRNQINIWYLILFAFIQFPLRFEGLIAVSYIYTYLIPGLYLLIHSKWTFSFFNKLIKNHAGVSFGIIFLFVVSVLWPLITGTLDYSYVTECLFRMILLFVKNLFLYSVFDLKIRDEKSNNGFVDYFVYSVCLYVISSIIIIIVPHFRDFMISVLYLTPKNREDLMLSYGLTRIGWAGWAGFDATIFCSLSVLFLCYKLLDDNRTSNDTTRIIACIFICIIGNMLYGRTGIAVSTVVLLMTVVFFVSKGNTKVFLRFLVLFIIVILLLVALKNRNTTVNSWFLWATSAFESFFETGEIHDNTGSFGHLIRDMYWVPPSETLFFGDGRYMDGDHYYMSTDSGIMRPMLYYGIINYFISIILFFCICYLFVSNSITGSKNKIVFAMLLIIVFTAVFEFKGETYYKIACILLPISILENNYREGLKISD